MDVLIEVLHVRNIKCRYIYVSYILSFCCVLEEKYVASDPEFSTTVEDLSELQAIRRAKLSRVRSSVTPAIIFGGKWLKVG